jgi:phosphotransacetylase
MKEFDFEQTVKRTLKRLREELEMYKSQFSKEFHTIENERKRKAVEPHQIRRLLTSPPEYILIHHIEDTGLAHAVPLTEYINLSPSNLRIYIRDLILTPLPFYVYIVKEALEKISRPVALVRPETVEKVLQDVEKTPHTSHIRPIDEFLRLVWKRYEQLTIASLLYNTIKREELDN